MIYTFDEYQSQTKEVAIYPKDKGVEYCIFGLVGEAGEIANKYKKVIRDNNGVLSDDRRGEIFAEMGDVMWYMSELASSLGYDLTDIVTYNIEKLQKRKLEGKLSGSGDKR